MFAKVRFKKCTCLPHKKTKWPSHQDFGEFALKVKKILQAAPPKLRREMGMCATTIYVQQQQQYYTIRVLVVHTPVSSLSFQVQHTWYIRPGRHAHEPGTSSASCCCNGSAVATGAWVESKQDMYLIHTNVEVWELKLYFYSQEDEKRKKRKAYLVPGAVHARTQQTIQIRGTGVCLARKNSL